jgi:arylsulfatase A-like enzyme
MRCRAALLVALGLSGALAAQPESPPPEPPRLLVVLVVDQMRADYVPAFQGDWTAGLRRLLDQGAWFTRAAYPYTNTFTCPGHATIATGAFPSRHGIVGNVWFDRAAGRQVTCTEDAGEAVVRYGGSYEGGQSAARLLVPTLGEHLQRVRRARVVALSVKARSAIMLGGRSPDAVAWLSRSLDGWQTSTAFTARPLPVVKAFVDANPIEADRGKTWTRLLPSSRYPGRDDAAGEAPPPGWTSVFPHSLSGGTREDPGFRVQWEHSPFADAYLGRFAADLVRTMKLGQGSGTDLLGVGFSAPDAVGHAFGPRSHEVRDVFAHLDRTIGQLLDALDALVGRDRYVVALTSDHGVDEVPAPRAGRAISPARVTSVVEGAANGAAGRGRYVAAVIGNHVYFRPAMYERLAASPGALARVLAALNGEPGIARAFTREQLKGHEASVDPVLRAAASGHARGPGGDLVFVLRDGFQMAATGTFAANHGTASDADRRVPVILAGPGIRRGRYDGPATPADIAPTLSTLSGVAMPGADGRVLREALLVDHAAGTRASR